MIDKELVSRIVEEKLATSDNYLVDVAVKPGNFIIVEIDNDNGVRIDDCAELSRYIEANLNREEEDFEIEVGSTGISAPFKILRNYLKNINNEVECMLKSGIKSTGILKSAEADKFTILVEKQVKPEGEKRKKSVMVEETYQYNDIKYVKRLIRFK